MASWKMYLVKQMWVLFAQKVWLTTAAENCIDIMQLYFYKAVFLVFHPSGEDTAMQNQ